MNSKNIFAIKDDKIRCTCVKCLNEYSEDKMHIIHIPEMGYGSGFDGFDTIIILCDECYKESIKNNQNIWSMKTCTHTVHFKKNAHLSDEERTKNKVNKKSKCTYVEYVDMQADVIYTKDFDEKYRKYEFEEEMFKFIYSLPLQGQELVYNRFNKGTLSGKTSDGQDYIDYELGELPDEICEKYWWRPCKKN